MNKTKIWFGLMIVFLITLWAITPFWFGKISIMEITPIIYNSTKHHSCVITIAEPTIILRMDDVRVYSSPAEKLISEILKQNLSIVLGVIPRDLEKDKTIIDYLKKIKINKNIEIAQHGFYHNETDINITEDNLIEGNIKIQKIIGIQPISYIPPFNKISDPSKLKLEKHFKVISAKNSLKEGKIAEIGQTIGTYDYSKNIDISNDDVIKECKKYLEFTNICVVVLHPQEWGENKLENFEDFQDLLYKLKQLNTTFSTFNKVVFCEEK